MQFYLRTSSYLSSLIVISKVYNAITCLDPSIILPFSRLNLLLDTILPLEINGMSEDDDLSYHKGTHGEGIAEDIRRVSIDLARDNSGEVADCLLQTEG